ncbi:MAG: hypothetical protein JXQ73_17215 [Phycisphaerae bacterium]|nr:hypothetical protein [Phycisphaerae bacterium]
MQHLVVAQRRCDDGLGTGDDDFVASIGSDDGTGLGAGIEFRVRAGVGTRLRSDLCIDLSTNVDPGHSSDLRTGR